MKRCKSFIMESLQGQSAGMKHVQNTIYQQNPTLTPDVYGKSGERLSGGYPE